MTSTTLIRAATFNLNDGGIDEGQEDRWCRQLDMLATLNLHVLALQELKNDDRDGWRRLRQAERALDMHGYAVPSNHHGCHLAMLIRDPLELVEERHDRATPWWHALCHLLVTVHGRLLHVAGVHFAPASPTQRLIEAEACSLIPQKGSAILLGDMNAVSLIDPPHPLGAEAPLRIRRKYDRRPAEELEGAGLRDVGAILGDSDPTVGHDSGLVYRCDRIHTTLPRTAMVSHRVIREEHPTSDHRPVVAEFDV